MPPITGDQLAQEIRETFTKVQDEVAILRKEGQTRDEALDKVSKENEERGQTIMNEIAGLKRQFVGPGRPMTEEQGRAAAQAGGVFDGKFKLGFERMLTLSENHAAVGARDKERLRAIHDLHDAVVFRYQMEVYKDPQRSRAELHDKVAKSIDFRMYVAQLQAAGYIDPSADFQRAANDILNPAGGTGVNLDYTLLSSNMIDLVWIEAVVTSQFPTVQLTRAKQDFPALRAHTKSVLGGGLTTYGVPANDPASVGTYPQATMLQRPTFGQVSFACIHNVGAIAWTDDMAEDSVVPFADQMRRQGAVMIARGRDSACINGDTAGTHMDTGYTVSAYDMRKAWDGLRKWGVNNHATITAAITAQDVNTLMQKLGPWARRQGELVLFLNVIDWLKLAGDDDVKLALNIGLDRATLRNGVTNNVFGVDIVLTEEIGRDLNTTGIYDSTTTDNTIEILCNRTRFWHGIMHDARVEVVRVPQALGQWLQVDVREDWQPVDVDAGSTFDATFIANNGGAPVAIAVDVTS